MPRILAAVQVIDLGGIKLDIPDPGGLFSGGLLSGVGVIMQLAFGVTLVVWIAISLLAGLKIIQSQGNPDKIQEGMTRIKYVWLSVSVIFIFFVIVSLVGAVFGYGTPVEWGNTLAQCGGYNGPFYFAQKDQQVDYYKSKMSIDADSNKVYCCVYDSSANAINSVDSPLNPVNLYAMGIKESGSNWVLLGDTNMAVDADGRLTWNGISNTGFTRCNEYGK